MGAALTSMPVAVVELVALIVVVVFTGMALFDSDRCRRYSAYAGGIAALAIIFAVLLLIL